MVGDAGPLAELPVIAPKAVPPKTAFDAAREDGLHMLNFSREWLTNPDRPATRDCNAVANGLERMGLSQDHLDTRTREAYLTPLISGRWAMSGFPTVTMGHRTAAVLMATSIKPDDAEAFVRCPWPAFAIRLPNDLLYIDNNGQLEEAALVMVTCVRDWVPEWEGDRWFYKIISANVKFTKGIGHQSIGLWGYNREARDLADSHSCLLDSWTTVARTSVDDRCDALARGLIIGTCLHLSGDPRQRPQGVESKVTQRKSKQREGDELPAYDEFELHSAVKINLHHAIRDYVRHGGSSPNVQTMVAGHWKRVAFGVGHANRRLQHVLPYWRGDVDSPISVRTGK